MYHCQEAITSCQRTHFLSVIGNLGNISNGKIGKVNRKFNKNVSSPPGIDALGGGAEISDGYSGVGGRVGGASDGGSGGGGDGERVGGC